MKSYSSNIFHIDNKNKDSKLGGSGNYEKYRKGGEGGAMTKFINFQD